MPIDHLIFDLQDVSFIRNGEYILSEINWQIEENSNWVLFGPNGSGKTTLLRIMTGYILPSRGNVQILDGSVGRINLPEVRKRVGWISNSLENLIHDEDPAIEIVVSGKFASTRLWERAADSDFKKADYLLKLLKCRDVADKRYGILSEGEKKKVLIARALMPEPEVLILDEPCEGLDIVSREQFLTDIELIFRQKTNSLRSIILVTHHVEEITNLFNNILMLKNGGVFTEGAINKELNSRTMSDLFNIPIRISKKNGRFNSELV